MPFVPLKRVYGLRTRATDRAKKTLDQENRTRDEQSKAWISAHPIPLSAYFGSGILILGLLGAIYLASRPDSSQEIAVPKESLPAYHLIREADLITVDYGEELPADAVDSVTDLVGRYTFRATRAKEPLLEELLGPVTDPAFLEGRKAVSIAASDSMTFGGNLAPGEVIDLSATLSNSEVSEDCTRDLYVLDLQPVGGEEDEEGTGEGAPTYSLVLAVKEECSKEFGELAGSDFIIIRSVEP